MVTEIEIPRERALILFEGTVRKHVLRTYATRLKMKNAHLGKAKPLDYVIKHSPIWRELLPLAIRELSPWEITEIAKSKFTAKQVRNAIYRQEERPAEHAVEEYSDPQKARDRQIEGIKKWAEKRNLEKSGAKKV